MRERRKHRKIEKKPASKQNLKIILSSIIIAACSFSFAFASENNQILNLKSNDNNTLTIKSIDKDNVKNLFLPSGAKTDHIEFPEGIGISNYNTMSNENIGSLHFYSDDPVEKGMDYIHDSDDHSTKAPGRVVLMDDNLNLEYEGSVEAIKGRGNSTWKNSNKKPYQIKLTKKTNLIDISDNTQKAKKWILLANDFDASLMRNHIAFSLAHEMGLESTPEGRFVDLYYDGDYRGVYYLCEKVEIGDGRVEIPASKENLEEIDSSYLLEFDDLYYKGNPYFRANGDFIVCKEPEEPSQNQLDYIAGLVREAFSCIENGGKSANSEKTLFDYFDKESLVKYFLVMQFVGNEDEFLTSTYMYRPEGEDKIYMGPVWDCDLSMGQSRITTGSHDRWFIHGLSTKLMNIREFRQAMQDEYKETMSNLIQTELLGDTNGRFLEPFTQTKATLSKAVLMNHTAWNLRMGGNKLASYQESISKMEQWLKARYSWLDSEINKEEFVKDTYKLQSETSKNTNNISKDTTNLSKQYKLSKPKIKVKIKKKKMIVSWKKIKKATGYQIRYYKLGKNKKVKNKTTKKRKITLKNIRRKARYSIKVRAYCKTENKVCYGAWAKRKVRVR